ncbi:MAG: c-type cytochrome [Planctomycetota bacterium]|jgi:mono/diheme cytochrome c family protein
MNAIRRPTLANWQVAVLVLLFALVMTASCRSGAKNAPADQSEGARLFAEHCAACHGADGTGKGPAARAVLVQPRDFRNEPFRYVSSMNGAPTKADIHQTIRNGRLLGEMPGHPWLTDRQVDLIAEYVLDLNRRGWIARLTAEFAEDEDLEPADIEEIAVEKITPRDVIRVPAPPPGFRFDTREAKTLYDAQCAACHGPTGRGDGLDLPKDSEGKPIVVRDLTIGDYRGGMSPYEIFKRVRCGVPGTAMPAQVQLDDAQVWQLTYYSLFLAGAHTPPR